MTMQWRDQQVPLKFMLGDWTICKRNVRLQVREARLSEGLTASAEPEIPGDPQPSGSEGFYVRSLPVSVQQPTLRKSGDYLCYVPSQFDRHYIDLKITFEEYKQKFSSKTRSTINRKLRKYAEHCGGSIPWKSYRSPLELDEFLTLARSVSAKTYQERLLHAGLPDSAEFRRDAARLAARDEVRGYILFHQTTPVSYLFCPIRDGVMLYQYLGYNPAYAQWSVGTLLQWCALEDIFAEGRFQIFDFTEGQGEHKRLFATHSARCANVMFLRDTVANGILIRSHILMSRLSGWTGSLLERYGLKSRLRRLIRLGPNR